MATLPPAYLPNLLRIAPQYTDASGRVHENVTWWVGSVAAGYSTAQLNAIGGEFLVNWGNSWPKIGATNAQLTGCNVQDFTSNTGASVFVSGPATGNLAAPAPINAAVLVSIHGGTRYRGGHSRWYLPSLGETITTDGVNVNTGLAAWTTFLTDFAAVFTGMAGISGANGGPCNPTIVHARQYNHSTIPPTHIPAFLEPMTSYTVQTKLASQRRRLRKAPHH